MSTGELQTDRKRIAIIGGGAAGFFAAIASAEAARDAEVFVFEKSAQFLQKVRISGGGRCNVTHACFEPRPLSTRYPRGERALIAPFHRFGPAETIAWFEARGVRLKTERDGRMFPVTDSSGTVIECLLSAAAAAGVQLFTRRSLENVTRRAEGGFALSLSDGSTLECDRLLLATGGCRTPAAGRLAQLLGHSIEAPVPSLFTFHVATPWLRRLPGVAAGLVEATVPGTGLRERGPLLITHSGVSGPAILRLSAWGARILHEMNYQFPLQVNWLPELNPAAIAGEVQARRQSQPNRHVVNAPIAPLPGRLWEELALAAGIAPDMRWTTLSREGAARLVAMLVRTELPVTGKSLHKDEFVICGGVRLREVNLRTMESRLCPGLYFAGELLDVDGITGGFNFQAAWTTGWIAGHGMAGVEPPALSPAPLFSPVEKNTA